MQRRLRIALLFLLPLSLLAPAATAQPAGGAYRARPAEVLACGGFVGDCRAMILDGTLELAVSAPADGGFASLEIVTSDLRLRAADGSGDAFPFPAPGDLQLSELQDDPGTAELLLAAPEAGPQTAALRVIEVGPSAVVIQGTYDEGCCDRFVYELGNVLFETLDGAPEAALVLGDGRFAVEVEWTDFNGLSGPGTPVKFDERSGAFWFFNRANPELLVKVLEGCPVNGHYWFFTAGLTNVAVEIRVSDGSGAPERTYENPLRRQFQPILDTTAFPCAGPST